VSGQESSRNLLTPKTTGPAFAVLGVLTGLFLQGSMQDLHIAIIAPGIVFVGLAMVCISWALAGKITIKRTPGDPFVLVMLIVGAIGFFTASNHRAWLIAFINLCAFAALYFTCTQTFNRRNAGAFIGVIAGVGAVAIVLGLLQDFVVFENILRNIEKDPKWLGENLPNISSGHSGDLISRIKSREVFSFFILSNIFAGFLLLMLPIYIGMMIDAFTRGVGRQKLLAVAPGLFAIFGGYLFIKTHSKGAWLIAAFVIVALIAWTAMRSVLARRKGIYIALGTFVLIFAAAVFLARAHIADALGVRLGFYATALKMWAANPISGVGVGNFAEQYFFYKSAAAHEVKVAHSLVMQSLAETGIIGTLAILSTWGVLAFSAWPRGSHSAKQKRPVKACIISCSIAAAAAFGLGYFLNAYTLPSLLAYAAGFAAVFYAAVNIPIGRATRLGLAVGFSALMLHALVDFDLDVPAVALLGAFVAVTGATLTGRLKTFGEYTLKTASSVALIVIPASVFVLFVFSVARPISLSSVRLSEAKSSTNPEERFSLVSEAVRVDPDSAEAQLEMALFFSEEYSRTGGSRALAEAEIYFTRADDLRPMSATVQRLWGRMYENRLAALIGSTKAAKGRAVSLINSAVSHYDKAIERYPTQPWQYYNRGRIFEFAWKLTGDNKYAREAYDNFIEAFHLYAHAGDLRLRFDFQTYKSIHKSLVELAKHLGKKPPPKPEYRK